CQVYDVSFFSSRRRHTRSKRDWSSDVCSSDLTAEELAAGLAESTSRIKTVIEDQRIIAGIGNAYSDEILQTAKLSPFATAKTVEIGRASCREREQTTGSGGSGREGGGTGGGTD